MPSSTATREMKKWSNKMFFDNFHAEWYNNDILNMKVREVMIYKNDISSLKEEIGEKIGQKIIVKGSLGRSKEFAKEGTIEKAYSNLFVVKYEENDRTASYTYTDLLTRTVEVDVFNGEEYSPLLPPLVIENKRKRVKEQLV